MDPAIVGASYRDQRDAVGTVSRTVFEFRPDGRYTLHNAATGHSGQFQARAGRWSQQAQTTRWEDAGAYTFPQEDVLQLTGMFGPSEWKRLAAPPYFRHRRDQRPADSEIHAAVMMQNLIEVTRPWRADAVPVMLQIERWKHGEFCTKGARMS